VEFDDHHQDKEMVYAVAKDDVNRRITLCFRGTDNQLAKDTNWSTNFTFRKVEADLPDVIQDKAIWFHGGFYSKFHC
jgi:N-methylhydantoinase B/oxoprolinase/acetone carboxylase alpha subunit